MKTLGEFRAITKDLDDSVGLLIALQRYVSGDLSEGTIGHYEDSESLCIDDCKIENNMVTNMKTVVLSATVCD